jgi:hypothetical protein
MKSQLRQCVSCRRAFVEAYADLRLHAVLQAKRTDAALRQIPNTGGAGYYSRPVRRPRVDNRCFAPSAASQKTIQSP